MTHYLSDTRYPGPPVHALPSHIHGVPTQAELDAFPRMFTWGELKEIVKSGDLEQLMRNKAMQARYDVWMSGMREKYGSTEKYLTQARLPWANSSTPEPTYDLTTDLDRPSASSSSTLPQSTGTAAPNLTISDLTSSTNPTSSANPRPAGVLSAAHLSTPGRGAAGRGAESAPGSGASTPSSAGFVSLASLKMVNGMLKRRKPRDSSSLSNSAVASASASTTVTPSKTPSGPGSPGQDISDENEEKAKNAEQVDNADAGADDDEYEDMPEPEYLRYEPHTGLDPEKYAVLPNDWPYNVPYGVRHFCVWSRLPIAHPHLVSYSPSAWSQIESHGLGGFTGITPLLPVLSRPSTPPSPTAQAREKSIGKVEDHEWYATDVKYAGKEMRRWAGVEYESVGGREVGLMVKGLWDERGWECLWFVNPPRLQSVPGFSHFHVFARRKTPEEMDAAEAAWGLSKAPSDAWREAMGAGTGA